MKTLSWVVAMAAAWAAAATAAAKGPQATETTPAHQAVDVDPNVKEIRVRFDQDMKTSSFSWTGGGAAFPKTRGQPKWIDARTCVLPVELEADHWYSLGINGGGRTGFSSAAGEPAGYCPIEFATAGTLTAAQNKSAVTALREAIDERYSYRDVRKMNWDKMFLKYSPLVENCTGRCSFAAVAGRILALADDPHIWLEAGQQTIPAYRRDIQANFSLEAASKAVPNWRQESRVVFSGRYEDGIGYILITSWAKGDQEPLAMAAKALGKLADAKGVIIDVRPNAGGSETLAQEFAGCFAEKAVVYSRHAWRDANAPGGFSKPFDRQVQPNKDGLRFRGKVAVLMGPVNMSSCESFLLMMKVCGATLIGEKSYGSSGNPKPADLGNGVTVYLPSWKDLLPDGTELEGKGIAPDVEVKTRPEDLREGKDPVLEAAHKRLAEEVRDASSRPTGR